MKECGGLYFKIIKGAGIIFLVSILSSAFGYFIRILLARKLTTEEFGLFFAVYSGVLMIGWIQEQTFEELNLSQIP